MRVRTRHPLYQFMQPVHLQLHGFCLGSVAGEVAPKKEAAMSSIRALTDQVFHSLNVKVCTFQSNFVALNGQQMGHVPPFFRPWVDGTTRNVQFYHEIYHATSQDHVAARDRGKKKKKKKKIFEKMSKKKVIILINPLSYDDLA